MFLEIDLPVFWLTEDQEIQADAGMDIPINECEIRHMTFYVIENIKDYNSVCIISSGGEDYTINMTRNDLKSKIRSCMIPNFN